jgi:hypothetical protein
MRSLFALAILCAALAGACGDNVGPESEQVRFPDVIDATATLTGDGSWTVAATLSSPYETADRYADAWRILGSDGEVLGVRELLHDHSTEQPFTRTLTGVEIGDQVESVVIEGRDQLSGWGGATFVLALDHAAAN